MALPRIIVKGRVSSDIKVTEVGGFKKADFSVCGSSKYKDVEKLCFVQCVAWRGTAEFMQKYFSKGQEIYIEGKEVTNSWTDQEGNNRSRNVVEIDAVDFCGKKSEGTSSSTDTSFIDVSSADEEELPFK